MIDNKLTHTPGPWVSFNYGYDLGSGRKGEGFGICSEGTSMTIVTGQSADSYVCEMTLANPHHKADAALIAAAPDLLEALTALSNECSGKPRPNMLLPLIEKARSAIAKARPA